MKLTKSLFDFYINHLSRFKVKPLSELKEPPKKFLIISHTALGDTLMSTPAIKSLKLSFPSSKIIAVIPEVFLPLFKNFPYVQKFYPYRKGLLNIFALGKKLKKEAPQVALVLHGNYPEDLTLCALSRPSFVLKSKIHPRYMRFLSVKHIDSELHAIEKRLFLVKALGGRHIVNEMEIGRFEEEKVRRKVERVFSSKRAEVFVGFQLGASHLSRAWPVENFAELGKTLSREFNCTLVLLGGKREVFLGKKFEKLYSGNNFLNLVGRLNIQELACVVKRLTVLVTPDTGPLHLAVALKVPTVSLFALSTPKDTGPIQDLHLHRIIFKPDGLKFLKPRRKENTNEAMKLISIKEVYSAVLEVLE